MNVHNLLDLAGMSLAFGRVDRVTRHQDGVRYETDTDHTVMLGLLVCSTALVIAPHLDRGLMAQYAIVHDLVEVEAGDTMSLGITSAELAAKHEREKRGLEVIRQRFGPQLPWIPACIDAYERRGNEEARYVYIMDKVCPKLTHLLNGGAALKARGITPQMAHEAHLVQLQRLCQPDCYQEGAIKVFIMVINECQRAWGVPGPQAG